MGAKEGIVFTKQESMRLWGKGRGETLMNFLRGGGKLTRKRKWKGEDCEK